MSREVNAHDLLLKDKIYLEDRLYEITLIRKSLLENRVYFGLKLMPQQGDDERFVEREFGFMDKVVSLT